MRKCALDQRAELGYWCMRYECGRYGKWNMEEMCLNALTACDEANFQATSLNEWSVPTEFEATYYLLSFYLLKITTWTSMVGLQVRRAGTPLMVKIFKDYTRFVVFEQFLVDGCNFTTSLVPEPDMP
nr:hypothetical protein HmN_000426700 [Hymenolepis microstoma]